MNEYISYLIPVDELDKIFLTSIGLLVFIGIMGTFLLAKPKYWERNWDNDTNTDLDDLDAQHGSVYDLSNAVATWAENLTAVLPGLLLVIGLLGTFLGVGVALNKATGLLTENGDPSNMITNMLPMLKGMGLTFKTSIYGVFGFLLVKLFTGAHRIEKKRILWVIKKSKPQIHARNEKLHKIQEQWHTELINKIAETNIEVSKVAENNSVNQEKLDKNHSALLFKIESSMSRLSDSLSAEINKFRTETINAVTSLGETVGQYTQETKNSVRDLSNVVTDLGKFIQNFGPQIESTANVLKKATHTIAVSADNLEASITKFGPMVETTLESMKNNFVRSIERSTVNISEQTTLAANHISQGVEKMNQVSDNNHQKLMESLKASDLNLAKISTTIITSSEALNKASKISEQTIGDIGQRIENNLDSISTSNVNMSNTVKFLNSTMNDIRNLIGNNEGKILHNIQKMERSLATISKYYLKYLERIAEKSEN